MSAAVVIRALLLAHGPVSAILGDRVHLGDVPQDEALPAIGVREISRIEQPTASLSESTVMVTARVQVTIHTKSYKEQKELLQAAKLAAGPHTGTISGVTVRSITRDIVGPDLSNQAAKTFEQSRDFKVVYIEPN